MTPESTKTCSYKELACVVINTGVQDFLNNPQQVHPGPNGFEHALVQQQTCSLNQNVQISRSKGPDNVHTSETLWIR